MASLLNGIEAISDSMPSSPGCVWSHAMAEVEARGDESDGAFDEWATTNDRFNNNMSP